MGLLHLCQRNDGASDLVARPIASFAHDGTERRIVRPQDPAEQTQCYSGKKKDHTVKNILLVNALLIILFLSETVGGRIHDKRLAEATPYPLPAGSRLLQDLGFMAFTLPQVEILMPTKKPPGAELKHPLISYDSEGLGEDTRLMQELGVSFNEGLESVFGHVGD